MTHTYVAIVMAAEVDEIDGGTQPEVEARQPHQDSVLEAPGEVWVRSVPRTVPILVEANRKKRIIETESTFHITQAHRQPCIDECMFMGERYSHET